MKRDPTVLASLFVLIGAWSLGAALGVPGTGSAGDPLHFHVIRGTMMIAALRIVVLWFQTLSHAVKHAPPETRMSWVLGHLILPPVMPYLYYVTYWPETGQRASAGTTTRRRAGRSS